MFDKRQIKDILLDQIGSDQIGLDQIGSDWIILDHIGSDWIRLDHIESDWIRSDQIRFDWIGLDQIRLDCYLEDFRDIQGLLGDTTLGTFSELLTEDVQMILYQKDAQSKNRVHMNLTYMKV